MNREARTRMWVICVVAWLASACPSVSVMTSARVLPVGKTRIVPAITVVGVETDQKTELDTIQPQLEVSVASGVLEDLEIGGRVWTLPSNQLYTVGVQFNAKVQLHRPPNPRNGVHVAIAPRASYHHMGASDNAVDVLSFDIPLLVGFTFGSRHELVVGPQVGARVTWMQQTTELFSVNAGASIGGILWVSDCFAFVPEVSAHYTTLQTEGDNEVWFWNAGLGVMFDI